MKGKNRTKNQATTLGVAESRVRRYRVQKEQLAATARKRSRGQAAVLIALSMTVLILMVGLAIDGGSALAQRRRAQNAADGIALAGAQVMLKYYERMVIANPNGDVDGSAAEEDEIEAAMNQYAAAHGVLTTTMEAYFVNNRKQITSVVQGEDRGRGHCNRVRPCKVGRNGKIPFTLGATGVSVKVKAETASFFLGLIDYDTMSAAARATAFMAVATTTGDVAVMPIGLFTRTIDINNIQFDRMYDLINSEESQGSGNWGWVTYNGNGSASVANSWIDCGFNPTVDEARWRAAWCPGYANQPGWGPAQHYRSEFTNSYDPIVPPIGVPYLRYGDRSLGWWLQASSGVTNNSYKRFYDMIEANSRVTPDGLGTYLHFPLFDDTRRASNNDLVYHLRIVTRFFIKKPTGNPSVDDISCRPITLPTATTCSGCPTPTATSGGSGRVQWYMRGKAKQFYDSSSSGELGDLRRAFLRTIMLDN